jgi:hypothetical protein
MAEGWNFFSVNATLDDMHPNVVLASLNPVELDQIKNQSQSSVYYEGGGWIGSLSSMGPGEGYMLSVEVGSELVYPSSDGMARTVVSLSEENVLPTAIASWDVNPHAFEFNGTIDMSIDSHADFDGDYIGVFVGDECRGISERTEFPLDGSYYYSTLVYSNIIEGEKLTFKYYSSLDDEIVQYAEAIEFTANMIVGNGFSPFGLSRIVTLDLEEYSLSEAYPNPFNPTTTLSFSVPTEGNVSLSIYDIAGRLVSTLVDGSLKQGYHSVTWNGLDSNGHTVSSGMYIYALQGEDISITKKMVLMK